MKKLSVILLLLFFSFKGFTQNGVIKYEIKMNSNSEEVTLFNSTFGNTYLDLFYSGKKVRINMDFGMIKSDLITVKKNGLILMEIFGLQTAIKLTEKDFASNAESQNQRIEQTNNTKSILGYECKQVFIYDESGAKTEVWFTPELKNYLKNNLSQYQYNVGGLPLLIITNSDGTEVVMEAKTCAKIVDKNLFSLEIPEGYTESTMEEFENGFSDY